MQPPPIASLADIRTIEGRPYEAFMPHASVLQGLEAAAARHAQRPALTFIASAVPGTGCRTWNHAEFVAQVRRAARAFQRLAGGEEPRVAFLLPAIPQAYFTLFGAEAAGVACPINYLLEPTHIAELLRAARANIVVALGPCEELDIWSRTAALAAECPGVRQIVAVGGAPGALDFDALLAAEDAGPLPPGQQRSANDVAALFHTGGTTGAPKLAQHTQRNQLHAAWSAACLYGANERDVILNGFPLFHVAGSFVYGLSILLAGGQVVLPTLLGLRNTAFVKAYWKHAEEHRVSLLATVPTVMSALLGVPQAGEDLRSVRCLLTGGSPLPTELAESFEQRTGIPVRNILGMTECGGVIAIEPAAAPRVPGSVGLPVPFSTAVAATEAGEPLPAGADGILQVRGPHVGPGYLDASANAGSFPEPGLLVTGDIGHVDAAGRLHVTGRAKDLIIRSSHNIDPVVIEDALQRHADVLVAAAVGAPDEYAGELPVAYVALRPGSQVSPEELLAFASQYIPERPAVPKAIHVLEAMPLTAIGKIFKPQLRADAARRVLQERLARQEATRRVAVAVQLEGHRMVAVFTSVLDESAVRAVRETMGAFALAYRIEAGATATPG